MRLSVILFLVFISVADCFCQNRNSVWCFGDSALIDFSDTTNIVIGTSSVKWRGSCVSICDNLGQLQFYAFTGNQSTSLKDTRVFNSMHQQMQSGDSIIGQGWYRELIIIPMPGSDSLYYLFSIGVTSITGLFYSVIDMSLNSGQGAVIQKNIQLESFKMVDCLTAVKHGNGRDWWIIFRRWDTPNPNSEIYSYLVTPNGITNYSIQYVGSTQSSGFGGFAFSSDGSRLAYINPQHLLELYDFDRCTGVISNPVTVYSESLQTPYEAYWGVAFSPSGNLLYISKVPVVSTDTSRLYQFDLTATNIAASADTLWESNFTETIGFLKLAPNNKIYLATNYYQVFPYNDTVYNSINMNLGVINSPDSLGVACNFQPYSFYLGGKRTYVGLPNNPDYEMPRLQGSPCDTIQWTSVQNLEQAKGLMYVTYISDWQKLFVNAQGLKGRSFKVSVYDMVGNVIYKEEGNASTSLSMTGRGYFTKDINMAAFAKGMYIVNFVTDKERLAKKFIKD